MKYDAFISYRHSEADLKIAQKIHAGLEKYHVPKVIQEKTGKKKINRVFRDQEELPIGSDLSGNITAALADSEFLIVICSPRTPESEWVKKEIDTFINLHGRQHVLAALIEGEPQESFPESLLKDEKGNSVEPLAADLRGINDKEINRKYKTEIIRLAAAILGCSYDDLKQRHRERIIRRNLAIASGVAGIIGAAGVTFGIYNANVAERMSRLAEEKEQLAIEKTQLADEKTELADEILSEYKEKQINQSRYLAAEALDLFNSGNVEDAVLVAKAALPADDDRPYVPEAEYALGKALHAYSVGDSMEYVGQLVHDVEVRQMKLDSENRLVSFDDSGAVYVWDTENQKRLAYIPYVGSKWGGSDSVIAADTLGNTIFVCRTYGFGIYDFDGDLIAEAEVDNTYTDYINACEFSASRKQAYLISNYKITVVNIATGAVEEVVENPFDQRYSYKSAFSDKSGILAVSLAKEGETNSNYVSLLNVDTMVTSSVHFDGNVIVDMAVDDMGFVAVSASDYSEEDETESVDYAVLIDAKRSELLWNKQISIGPSRYEHVEFRYVDSEESQVVFVTADKVNVYDKEGKQLVNSYFPQGITDICIVDDMGFIADRNGTIDTMHINDGTTVLNDIFTAGRNISSLLKVPGQMCFRIYGDSSIYLFKGVTASDLNEILTVEAQYKRIIVSNDGKYIAVAKDDGNYTFYDENGKPVSEYTTGMQDPVQTETFLGDDTLVMVSNSGEIVKYNPETGQEVDFGAFPEAGLWDCQFSEDGKYILIPDSACWKILSTEDGSVIADGETEADITAIRMNEDASKVYLYTKTDKLTGYDVSSGERYSLSNDELMPVSSLAVRKCHTIMISPDGKYGAMLCEDRTLKIFNTENGSIISNIPVVAVDNFYMKFSPDSEKLVYQGDNRIVCEWDVTAQKRTGYYEAKYSVQNVIYDTDHGKISIEYYTRLDLLDSDTFVKIAETSAVKYVPETGAIIAIRGKHLFSLYYKDYKTLISEADEKYENAELSEEERMKYLID